MRIPRVIATADPTVFTPREEKGKTMTYHGTHLSTLRTVILFATGAAAVGCGDSTFSSICEMTCSSSDDCPGVGFAPDCVERCEQIAEDAELRGPSCASLAEDLNACLSGLTCGEQFARASSLNTECTPIETELVRCLSQPPIDDLADRSSNDTPLARACEQACDAYDTCETTRAVDDCVNICIESFSELDNGTPDCLPAIVDAVTCQTGLSCVELYNRAEQTYAWDECFIADDRAASACGI